MRRPQNKDGLLKRNEKVYSQLTQEEKNLDSEMTKVT